MTPLIDRLCLLKKFPGKGGWTYTDIDEIPMDKSAPFGWVQVSGTIDDYELKNYKLMPMGNGKLFLPVKAEIRKKINKHEGDYIKVTLFMDDSSSVFPEEIIDCFKDEPDAYLKFNSYTENEQKDLIDWIIAAKKDEIKVERIVKTINMLLRGEKLIK
jgi:hypothetical protein